MKKIASLLLSLTLSVMMLSSFATTANGAYYSTAFIGDSICKMGQWNEYFERTDIDNFGVGGYTSAQVLDKLKTLGKDYEQLFILCGINDKKIKNWTYDISISNFTEMIDYATENMPGVEIYIIGLLPTSGEYENMVDEGFQAGYNDKLEALAKEYDNVTFINCYAALSDSETGYYIEGLTTDGLHPEYDGFIKIAEIVEPYANLKKTVTINGGDINYDGNVDIIDVVLARSYIVGNNSLSDEQKSEGDINGDEKLDIIDVALMRNYIVNK